jgi:hypothetical protein
MAMAMEIRAGFSIEASWMEGIFFELPGVGVGIEGWLDDTEY